MIKDRIVPRHRKKIRIGILFGGQSAEHEVSLVSAASIINAIDRTRYTVIPIGITHDGRWFSDNNILADLQNKRTRRGNGQCILTPDPNRHGLLSLSKKAGIIRRIGVDVIFPVIHGTFGEDGTIQGLIELANIPYVGAGVLGSSVGMDKIISKQLCVLSGVPVSPYVWFYSGEYKKKSSILLSMIEKNLTYPLFVKPANLGSSVGISKVNDRKELRLGIDLAGMYDKKILVERSIENAREIEISVLGNDTPRSSVPGEIIPSNEFYDYDAKYVDGKSRSIVPAELPQKIVRQIQKYAVDAFRALECSGMARVDFLVGRKSGKIYFNEINTIPGFTAISMYPKLWEASGIPYKELLHELILLAIERHREKCALKRTYKPKSQWYR